MLTYIAAEPDGEYEDDDEPPCWKCNGEGMIEAVEHGSFDPVNDFDEDRIVICDCCGGSGDADDCCFW